MTPRQPSLGPLVDAAVMVPVYRNDHGELRVVLVRRTDGGAHGGQIALPGGKREPGDESFMDTALREAHEEIGIQPEKVEVLVELPEVVTITTRFHIHPFLCRIVPRDPWRIEEREIAEVFDVAVSTLADPGLRGESVEQFPSWPEPRKIEFLRIGPHRLWGATFRILDPLVPRLLDGDWGV